MPRVGANPWDRGGLGWYIRIYHEGRQQARKVGPPGEAGRRVAEALCADINGREARGKLWQAKQEKLPTDALLRAWTDIYGPLRAKRTQATDRALVEHLACHFGARDLSSLRASDAQRFVAEALKAGKSGDLVANALSILRRVLNLAVEDGLLEKNPMPRLGRLIADARRRTRREAHRRDAWTHREAQTLLELAARHEHALWPALAFAFGTGARRGELLALRWEDLELPGGEAGRAHIRRAVEPGKGGGTKAPKSGRDRFVPLGAGLVQLLLEHLQRQHRSQLRGGPEPEWVFASPQGRPWLERNFSRTWERLRRRGTKAGIRPLPFHATRHSFVTWALEDGRSVARVARWVGASAAVIHAHYEHVLRDGDEGTGFADLVAGKRWDDGVRRLKE